MSVASIWPLGHTPQDAARLAQQGKSAAPKAPLKVPSKK